MYQFRISRFRPGVSQSATSPWTSRSDIGETFDDGVLTLAEYERVEDRYIGAVRMLLEAAGSPELTVSDLHVTPWATPSAEAVVEGGQLKSEQALEVCRLDLREELSCRLDNGDRFHIAVGFDYYLYVGTAQPSSAAISLIEESGLFVEHGVPSPYLTA
jgi:hypothetical protein